MTRHETASASSASSAAHAERSDGREETRAAFSGVVGNVPEPRRWMLPAATLLWLAWLGFLVAMMLMRTRTG